MRKPNLAPIKSTLFDGHHYDPATSRLTLKFSNGDTWEYRDVPMEKATAFAESASPGRYFGERIRGAYSGRKI